MFNFLWDRLGDNWLRTRAATTMFSSSAVLIIVLTLILILAPPDETSLPSRIVWAIGGILLGSSIFFLWSGMWRFWTKFDQSSRITRKLCFLLLLVGLWYGAVVYFLAVYVPWSRQQLTRGEGGER